MSDWQDYIRDVLGGRTQAELAALIGADQATVSRWLRGGGAPSAEKVVQLARSVGRQPLAALVAAGFLTEPEARQRTAARPKLSSLSDEDLLEELRRRLAGTNGSEVSRDAATTTGAVARESGPGTGNKAKRVYTRKVTGADA